MSDFIFPAPPQPSIAIQNTAARFPVRRIFCVGKNYADHVAEMGGDPQPPVFFTKPADAIFEGGTIPYPPQTNDLHYEAELVVALASGGSNIPADAALDKVAGYAAGNDLTRRDLQFNSKSLGNPWDMAKGFDRSAVIGPIHLVSDAGHPTDAQLTCTVNGETRQDSSLAKMIWSVPQIIETLSTFVELQAGDLIYTGTPAGVGPITSGDTCDVAITGLGTVSVTIAD